MEAENNFSPIQRLLVNVLGATIGGLEPTQSQRLKSNLLLLMMVTLMFRLLSSTIINDLTYDYAIGESFWVLGLGGRLLQVISSLLLFMAVCYLLIVRYCDHCGSLGFLADIEDYGVQLNEHGSVRFGKYLKRVQLLMKFSGLVLPWVVIGVWVFVSLLSLVNNPTFGYGIKHVLWNVAIYFMMKPLTYAIAGVPALGFLVATYSTLKLKQVNADFTLSELEHGELVDRFVLKHTAAVEFMCESNEFLKLVLGSANFVSAPMCSSLVLIVFMHEFEYRIIPFMFTMVGFVLLCGSLLIVKAVGNANTEAMLIYPTLNSTIARKLQHCRKTRVQVI